MGFLIIKELNYRQVRQVEILIEYHFKIQYTKGTKNIRVDILSRKAKLQDNRKLLGVILKKDSDGLIRYNYPKIKKYKFISNQRVIRLKESKKYRLIIQIQTSIK